MKLVSTEYYCVFNGLKNVFFYLKVCEDKQKSLERCCNLSLDPSCTSEPTEPGLDVFIYYINVRSLISSFVFVSPAHIGLFSGFSQIVV